MESLQILHENRKIKNIRPPVKNIPEEEISEDGKAVSEAEYWEKYYSHPVFSYEWNNGYLEEKPVTDYAGFLMYWWFIEILKHFLRVRPVAKVTGLEMGFRLDFPGGTSIRKPDMGVIRNENPTKIRPKDFSYSGTFDLCIEYLSYSSLKEVRRDTVQKKGEYEGTGVEEYFILDPRGLETAFYRLDESGIYREIIPEDGDIIRSRVLPGFQFRISDLYRQPEITELAGDSVYQSYVMREFQAEKQRAEKEKQKAEKEKQKAEREKQKAEREKQRAGREKQKAEKEKQKAEREKQKTEREKQRVEKEKQKVGKLAEKLRNLGIPEEEIERLCAE